MYNYVLSLILNALETEKITFGTLCNFLCNELKKNPNHRDSEAHLSFPSLFVGNHNCIHVVYIKTGFFVRVEVICSEKFL